MISSLRTRHVARHVVAGSWATQKYQRYKERAKGLFIGLNQGQRRNADFEATAVQPTGGVRTTIYSVTMENSPRVFDSMDADLHRILNSIHHSYLLLDRADAVGLGAWVSPHLQLTTALNPIVQTPNRVLLNPAIA